MELGSISLWGDDLEAFRKEIRTAEDLGFTLITVGDSPAGWHELYTSLTVAALETTSATLAPMVTIPISRHPVVAASAMTSLYDLAGGRVAFALGTGGSAVTGMGREMATQDEAREYLLTLRRLFNGEPATWQGRTIPALRFPRPVPLYYSASGPKALKLAGEVADGVVLSVGSSMEEVDHKLKAVREAAAAAGRDPAAVDIWAYSFISVRETRDAAVEDVSGFLPTIGAYGLRPKWAFETVPTQFKDKVRELQQRYDTSEHVVVGGVNDRLVRELGLTDYLAGLRTISGTAAHASAALQGLAERGVSRFMCALPGNADPIGTMNRVNAAYKGG